MNLNDGESFGLNTYEFEVEEHPVDDYFSVERSQFLNDLLFRFFIECYWNSKLFEKDIICIYSHTTDCDSLVRLDGSFKEYHSIQSILENHV